MSEISNRNGSGTSFPSSAATEKTSSSMDTVFQRLEPREVEQFYKSYHFWLLQRRIDTLYTEASAIQQAIIDNNTLMQQIPLSAIALASLAQLQASGVSDLNLLDRMLERGETWLDHTMQLLEHCEKLDVIQGDYTQWCEHALEGAYDWIASMEGTETINSLEDDAETLAIHDEQQVPLHPATEEQLLQKLMDDEEATAKITSLNSLLNKDGETTLAAPTRKITQPLDQTEATHLTAPIRKITQPLDQSEALIETEPPIETTAASTLKVQIEPPDSANTEIIVQPATSPSQEEREDDATATMPALSIEQISEEVASIKAEDASKDANIYPVEDAIVNKEASAEITPNMAVVSVSPQENKKPQLQKVRRKGFWRLLNRLLALILRR
jgi:hypothetical protein